MSRASQSFVQDLPADSHTVPNQETRRPSNLQVCLQVAVAYVLIEAAVWTKSGSLDVIWMVGAALCILLTVLGGRYSAKEMGVAIPSAKGSAWILLSALALAALIPAASSLLGTNAAPTHPLPPDTAWRYAVWSLVQQFILESFFFLRLETLLGAKWAVPVTAALFAVIHVPSPILTILGFLGGLFFCEMFRRYRNIFPLGAAHALFGLAIAASFSDRLLHHMRVGIAYWIFRP